MNRGRWRNAKDDDVLNEEVNGVSNEKNWMDEKDDASNEWSPPLQWLLTVIRQIEIWAMIMVYVEKLECFL